MTVACSYMPDVPGPAGRTVVPLFAEMPPLRKLPRPFFRVHHALLVRRRGRTEGNPPLTRRIVLGDEPALRDELVRGPLGEAVVRLRVGAVNRKGLPVPDAHH